MKSIKRTGCCVYREPYKQSKTSTALSHLPQNLTVDVSLFIPWLLEVLCVVLSVAFVSLNLGFCFLNYIPVRETSLLEIKEDMDLDPEENSTVFMGILIKGLAKLKKIPETVKAIQDRLEQELKQIVKRSTTQVADNGYQRGENISQENQPR